MCVARHYSHKWQANFGTQNYGIYDGDRLLGVAVYGHPKNPKAWPSVTDTPPEKCIELNRLWVDDELGANTETWLLSQTFRLLREDGYELVQSFADGRLGVGTIYQAANFTYHGFHTTTFHRRRDTGEVINDTPFHNTARASGMLRNNALEADGLLDHFRVRTYRYLYPLTKRARRAIKLPALPYPKERAGEIPTDYRTPKGQAARCVALAEAVAPADVDKFTEHLRRTWPDEDHGALIDAQRANRWVVAAREKAAVPA